MAQVEQLFTVLRAVKELLLAKCIVEQRLTGFFPWPILADGIGHFERGQGPWP